MRFYLDLPEELVARVDALVEADRAAGVDPAPTRSSMLRACVKRGCAETERKRGKGAAGG